MGNRGDTCGDERGEACGDRRVEALAGDFCAELVSAGNCRGESLGDWSLDDDLDADRVKGISEFLLSSSTVLSLSNYSLLLPASRMERYYLTSFESMFLIEFRLVLMMLTNASASPWQMSVPFSNILCVSA